MNVDCDPMERLKKIFFVLNVYGKEKYDTSLRERSDPIEGSRKPDRTLRLFMTLYVFSSL